MKNILRLITSLLIIMTISFLFTKFKKELRKQSLKLTDIDTPFRNESVKVSRSDYSEEIKKDNSLVQFHTSSRKLKTNILNLLESLTERQKGLYNYIMKNGDVDMNSLKRVFSSVTTRTLRRDLTELSRKNLIEKIGNTKGVFYKMTDSSRKI